MKTRTLGYVLAVLLGSALTATGCATTSPMGAEKEAKPADLETLKTVGAEANGLVVWTSSRAGRPHLFTMKTDGSDTKQITKGGATDWRPLFSPDGTKILFARSHEKGFVRESQANEDGAWDLYTVSPDGDSIDKVVENATWGSWIAPDEILFMRGSKILRTKLGSGDEIKIMDTARYPFFEGAIVRQPELSRDGHFLALTLAGNRAQTGIWNIKHKTWTRIGAGAQIAWAPDGASVYWVDAAGNDFSRIAHETVTEGQPPEQVDAADLVLVDLKGKRSREFFPRFSNDGAWLVFGAAIHDLEHDLEDFEIYLWKAGAASDAATRMTFHSASDRWPDVFVGEPGKIAAPRPSTNAEKAEKKLDAEPGDQAEDKPLDEVRENKRPAREEVAPREQAVEPAAKPERAAKKIETKTETSDKAADEASDEAAGDSNDWDDAPKTATKKAPAKQEEPEAAPAAATPTDEDAMPTDEAAGAPASTKPSTKHKKKKRR
jgi:Tol biopolymer transport system component